MTDNPEKTSTPNYSHGYGDETMQVLNVRSAETEAAYLLPYLKPGMRVLDVGCGPGTISVGLAAAVKPGELHGIDMDESQIDLAIAAAQQGGHVNAHFQVADALSLSFPDSHFDAVHCHGFLTHIPDTGAALGEIKRVLRPGGIFGSREYIGDSGYIEPDIGGLSRVPVMYTAVLAANGAHPNIGRELRTKLNEAGFVDIDSHGSFHSYGSSPEIMMYMPILGSLMPPFITDQAIDLGIATREEVDAWVKAADVWKDHPGAFAGELWGETIGHKP